MYKLLLNSTSIIRLSDSAYIPKDERNGEWRDYQKWIEDGNTPLPADFPPLEKMAASVKIGMMSKRLDIFRVLDTLQVDALTSGDQPRAQAIMQAKAALMALNNIDLSPYQTSEAMEQAIQLAYWGIVSQAPQEVQDAFNALVPR